MKSFNICFTSILIFICVQFLVTSCANVGSPTGGPKDTIPPLLLKISPGFGTLNFNESVVRLEFNEPIQLKDFNNQLIITPTISGKYKTKLSKSALEIIFDQPFDSSTTYTLNFREGIVDMNESNPPEDLSLAFSTGSYLDSLELSGRVTELLNGKPLPDALVTLYKAGDTLDTFNSRPLYLSMADEDGYYNFKNLKAGKYRIYTTNDLNKNLKTDPKNEGFGFLKDTIELKQLNDSLHLNILNINTLALRINNSRPTASNYDITLSKAITDYQIEPLQPLDQRLYSNTVDNEKKVRIYNTFPIADSLAVSFTAKDSIGQVIEDTLYVKFEESKLPAEKFTYAIIPNSGSAVQESFKATITFNKPVLQINHDSLFFQYDSLTIVRPDTSNTFTWNKRKDKLTIQTLLNANQPLVKVKTDTIADDPAGENKSKSPKGVVLYLGKAAFISAEKDSSTIQKVKYSFADPKNYGTISGNLNIPYDNFSLQLLQAGNFSVVQEIKNLKVFKFNMLPAGEYVLRVLVDENGNGQWDPGNILKREEPEPVIIYPEKVSLKANWEITDLQISE